MDSVCTVFDQHGQIHACVQGFKSGNKVITAESNALSLGCETMLRAIKYGKRLSCA